MATATDLALSAEQRAAVDCDAPAIVLTASAGSGKTEVVSRRVERLLAADPGETSRVLALSYTVKAAEELRQRFQARLGDQALRVDTETLHRFAHDLVRKHGSWVGLPAEPEVLQRDEDRAELLARWLHDEGTVPPDDVPAVLRALDLARARCKPSAAFLNEWRAALAAEGALDFAAMIERGAEVAELPSARRTLRQRYAHIIVDEAQNLTPAQYRLLSSVIGGPPLDATYLMMVGDPKQSIVGFSGADATLITTFADQYDAARLQLSVNYRSASKIVALGNSVAAQLDRDVPPSDDTYAADGSIKMFSLPNEATEGAIVADWVAGLLSEGLDPKDLVEGEPTVVRPEEIAVLGRSAASLRATRARLEARGIDVAAAVSMDDWLTSPAGRIILELIALHGADHRGPKLQLARLLDLNPEELSCLDDVATALKGRDDDLPTLATLCHVGTPSDLMSMIDGLEIREDPDWEADRLLLHEAWESFVLRTEPLGRTWGNLRVFFTRLQSSNDLSPGVRLLTLYKSQGREYRAVAVVGMNDGQFPDFRAETPEETKSELRAFYVAATRPTRTLLFTRSEQRATRYGTRGSRPSPFLDLVGPHVG